MIQNTLKFNKGDYIYRTGDESDFLYILKEGLVHVFRSDGKHEIDFGKIGVGGVVGESVLADMTQRQTSVLVIQDVVALVLSKEEFKMAIEEFEPWVFALTRTLISRHERVIERVERTLDDYIDASVAQLLCYYSKSDADLYVPKITAQIAMLLRSSEEQVEQSLSLLSKFGFIKINDKTVYISESERFITATNELRIMTLEAESYVKDFQGEEGADSLEDEIVEPAHEVNADS
ncbi:MAG: Crp/Fnr family transcriptional regulator [Fibrobacterales bacterium]